MDERQVRTVVPGGQPQGFGVGVELTRRSIDHRRDLNCRQARSLMNESIPLGLP